MPVISMLYYEFIELADKPITLCYCMCFCTRQKSLFLIDGDEGVRTRTRGKLHHTHALDRSTVSTKLIKKVKVV